MAFNDVNSAQYWGKTGIPALTAAIDANFALMEAGGAGAVTVDSLVCTAGATFGGGYGATGCTISTVGVGQFNGALTTDGLLTSAGVTTSAIVQINDNVALNFEGVAADVDGLQLTCDNAGDAIINVTAGQLTLTTSDGQIDTLSRIAMGAQGAAVPVSTDNPFGLEVQTAAAASVVYGATGWSAGVYSRYEVSAAQTNGCTHVGVGGKMRVKASVTAGGLAAVYGYLEISGATTVISGSSSTFAAGQFAIEADTDFELTDGYLTGIVVDSSVHAGATISGTMAGIRIKKSGSNIDWPTGISVEDCATGIDIAGATTGINIDGAMTKALYINPTVTANTSLTPIHVEYNYTGAGTTGDKDFFVLRGAITQTTSNALTAGHRGYLQGIRSDCTVDGYVDCGYGFYAKLTVAGTSVAGELFGMNSVWSNGTFAVTLDESGNAAAHGVSVNGSGNVTCSGTGYGKLSGMYINWNQTGTITVDTCGIYLGVALGSALDSGYRVNASGTLTSSFHSYNSSGTPTNALKIEGAHTNAFAFPAEGTAPTVDAAQAMTGETSDGYIVVTVGGTAHKMYYFA